MSRGDIIPTPLWMSMQRKYVRVNALFSQTRRVCVRLVVLLGRQWRKRRIVQFLSHPFGDKRRDWPGVGAFGGGGGVEDRGQSEHRDSHYHSGLRCLLFPTCHIHRLLGSPQLFYFPPFFFSFLFFILIERSLLANLPNHSPQNSGCYTPVSSGGEGRSGRGIDPGLPHSALGFQHRGRPLKVSGAGAPAAGTALLASACLGRRVHRLGRCAEIITINRDDRTVRSQIHDWHV